METFQQFIAKYPRKRYEKGELVLFKNDIPENVFVIETGLVKTYSITRSGSERLIAIDGRHADFPIGYALGIVNKSEYFYEAFTKCSIRLVPQTDFVTYIHTNIATLHERHLRLVILLVSTLARVNALEQAHAGDKILYSLAYMAEQVGVFLKPYEKRKSIAITQQEIANLLGITRETTSIELKKLEIKKIISHSRKNYILYMERLEKYINERQ